MTGSTRPAIALVPFQRAFVEQFCAEMAIGTVHILKAPPGTGKTMTVVRAIARLTSSGRAHRILVLSPAALTRQWSHAAVLDGVLSHTLDSKSLRLLREEIRHTSATWPIGVSVLSIDVAKRREITDILLSTKWDLVVFVEEVTLAGRGLELFQAFQSTESRPARLVVTGTLSGRAADLLRDCILVDWSRPAREFLARSVPAVQQEIVAYSRTDEECALLKILTRYAASAPPVIGDTLLSSAASSPASLERSLSRTLVEQTSTSSDDLKQALVLLDDAAVDSRLSALKGLLLRIIKSGHRHAVVFSAYAATVEYLRVALDDLPAKVHSLIGGMPSDVAVEQVNAFRNEGGVIVASDAASQGLEFGFVEAAIHYDLPRHAAGFLQREGRYRRFTRAETCYVYLFEDSRGGLAMEQDRLRHVERLNNGIPTEEVDPDGSYDDVVRDT
jgi:hypothetical protein